MRVPAPERIPVSIRLRSDQALFGINVTASTAAVTVAVAAGALEPTADRIGRLVPVCLAALTTGAALVDAAASAVATVIAFFLTDGFLVNRLGVITWHGTSDVDRILALVCCAVVGWVVGVVW